MKTLLKKNKSQFLDQQTVREQDPKQELPHMVIRPLKPKMDRITSSHITSKIIKKIPPKSALPQDFGIVGQQVQLQNQNQYFEHKVDHGTYCPEETENQMQKYMIIEENRAQTAPEKVKRVDLKPKDFKDMIYKFKSIAAVQVEQKEEIEQDQFMPPSKQIDLTNPSVRKHIQKFHLQRPNSQQLISKKHIFNVGEYLEQNKPTIRQTQSQQKLTRDHKQKEDYKELQELQKQNEEMMKEKVRPLTTQKKERGKERNKSVKFGLQDRWFNITNQAVEESKKQDKNQKKEFREIDHLDLETDELTHEEREYIKKKRNNYLDDLRPFINGIQMQQQQQKQMLLMQNNSNLNKNNTILSNIDTFEEFDKQEENSFEMLEDDCEINQQPLKGIEVKHFFHEADSVNQSFINNLQDTQLRFKEMVDDDERQREEKAERLRNEPEQYLKYDRNISQQEVKFLLDEFKKDIETRNYELLDTIVKQLKFFQKFSKQTRILLLRLSQVVQYDCNQYIFREGDEGDLMYIILSGACHVRVKNEHMNQQEDPVVATLYDGQQFGELALIDNKDSKSKMLKADVSGKNDFDSKVKYTMNDVRKEIKEQQQERESLKNWWKKEKNDNKQDDENKESTKRSASIQTAEQTYLLTISRDYFQSILLNLITQELEDKLKTLLVLPCFDFMSPMQLIPIANLMETKIYKLGDVILREGQAQKYFYLIAKGRCKVIKEEVVIRDKKKLGMSKTKKKDRLNFGIMDYKNICPKSQEKQRVRFNYQNGYKKGDSIQKNEGKSFQYEKILDDEGHLAFKYHFYYDDLVRGDFFMGRALLSEYKQLEPQLNELEFDTDEPSRLTVISDAALTEVYVLEKSLIHIIPFPLKRQKMLIDGILLKQEFDQFFDQEEIERVKKWDTYKTDLFKWAVDLKSVKKFNYFKMY